jgi:hypothetical protein
MRSAYAGVCVLSCVCQGGAVSSFAGLPSRTPSLPTRQPAPTRHAQLGKALALKRRPKPTSANPSPFRSVAGVSVQDPPRSTQAHLHQVTCIGSFHNALGSIYLPMNAGLSDLCLASYIIPNFHPTCFVVHRSSTLSALLSPPSPSPSTTPTCHDMIAISTQLFLARPIFCPQLAEQVIARRFPSSPKLTTSKPAVRTAAPA